MDWAGSLPAVLAMRGTPGLRVPGDLPMFRHVRAHRGDAVTKDDADLLDIRVNGHADDTAKGALQLHPQRAHFLKWSLARSLKEASAVLTCLATALSLWPRLSRAGRADGNGADGRRRAIGAAVRRGGAGSELADQWEWRGGVGGVWQCRQCLMRTGNPARAGRRGQCKRAAGGLVARLAQDLGHVLCLRAHTGAFFAFR